MSDSVTKIPRKLDSFDGYDDSVEGEEGQRSTRSTAPIIKFTNEATWKCNGEEMPADIELIVADVSREVIKWGDGELLDVRTIPPGQQFPNVKKMNAETPQTEWRESPDGKLEGPWKAQHTIYLLNLETMDAYRFPTDTIGGHQSVREIVDKTKWMRRYRGAYVHPVVKLSDKFMPTRFGGRQRPFFIIQRWIVLGDDGVTLAPPEPTPSLPPANVQATLDQFAAPVEAKPETAPPEKTPAKPEATPSERVVKPPSHAEEMEDSIPFLR